MGKFRIGTPVKITRGEYKGMKGNITLGYNKKTKRYTMGNSIATFHVPSSFLIKFKGSKKF